MDDPSPGWTLVSQLQLTAAVMLDTKNRAPFLLDYCLQDPAHWRARGVTNFHICKEMERNLLSPDSRRKKALEGEKGFTMGCLQVVLPRKCKRLDVCIQKNLTTLVDYFSSLCSLIHISLSLWGFQKQSIDYFVKHLACDNWIQPS